MESLQNTLEKVTRDNKRAKKLRRYIVVEAVYQVVFIILLTGVFVLAVSRHQGHYTKMVPSCAVLLSLFLCCIMSLVLFLFLAYGSIFSRE